VANLSNLCRPPCSEGTPKRQIFEICANPHVARDPESQIFQICANLHAARDPKWQNFFKSVQNPCSEGGGRAWARSLDGLGLKGSLPPDVADLGYLQVLNLSSNSFTGALPDSWGYPTALPNLTVLLLDNNQLQGSLPSGWANPGSLYNLVLLNIGNNNLSGVTPPPSLYCSKSATITCQV
jgi:Leucine Rich Repeat